MNERIQTVSLIMAMSFFSIVANGQDLKLNPKNGYTHEQATALFSKFDLATWNLDWGDLSRFAYINTSPFFPHALIHRDGPVSQLQSAPNAAIGKTKAKTHAGVMTLDEWPAGHLGGCIVILDGKIVYERYPRMRPRDKHIWWSVSKSVAGTIVGMLRVAQRSIRTAKGKPFGAAIWARSGRTQRGSGTSSPRTVTSARLVIRDRRFTFLRQRSSSWPHSPPATNTTPSSSPAPSASHSVNTLPARGENHRHLRRTSCRRKFYATTRWPNPTNDCHCNQETQITEHDIT